jgi:transposase
MLLRQNLGVDIAAKNFRVCLKVKNQDLHTKIKGQRKFDNTPSGFEALHKWLSKKVEASVKLSVTMEATGVYYERLAFWLYDLGYSVHVLLPNRIKGYFKFMNLKSKTDKLEAKALAELGLDKKLPEWKPASPQMYALKRLTRERNTLLDEKTAISNRLHAEQSCRRPGKRVIKRQKRRIALIHDQIKEVEQQMKELAAKDQPLCRRIENTCKIKGVAFITVLSIIAETNGFELVEHKSQLVSYAGYDVIERESGTSVKGKTRISKQGNSHIRRALHFPAINVVKYHEEFKSLHERVFDRTKIKMKGYVAVQRKLLVLIYTLYKKNVPYDPNYYKQQQVDQKESRQDTMPAYTG